MSPPPGRTARSPTRVDMARQRWQLTAGTGNGSSHIRNGNDRTPLNNLEFSRWRVPITSPSLGPGFSRRAALANAGDEPTDWVDRVRKMPTSSRSPSPGIVQRMPGTRSPASPGERSGSASLELLGPGPMPSGAPNQSARYVSEPPGLALLSGVAAPGAYPVPRRASYEDRSGSGSERESGRRVSGGRSGGMEHHGHGGAERDADDLPPPGNPIMGGGMSFDPNREDPNFPFPSLA